MPFSRLGPVTGLPLMAISPSVGTSRPPTILIRVVFPQPEGPTKTTNSPIPMSRDSGLTTGIALPSGAVKSLVTSVIAMKGLVTASSSMQVAEPAPVKEPDRLVRHEADDADRQNAGEDLGRLAVAPCHPQLVADARNGG